MAYSAILDAEIEVGDAITQSLMQKIADNDEYLFGQLGGIAGSGIVPNGSFDIDSDADGDDPDSWSITDYAGGSHTLSATDAAHGAYALKFVHPSGAGNGGGYADSDFMPCNELSPFFVRFLHKCSQSGVKVQVVIRYFSEAQVDLSADETIYSQTTNPTSWNLITTDAATPPATAQYFKIRMIGGFTDTDPGSSTDIFFDDMSIIKRDWNKDRSDTLMNGTTQTDFTIDTDKDYIFSGVGISSTSSSSFLFDFSDDGFTSTSNVSGSHVDDTTQNSIDQTAGVGIGNTATSTYYFEMYIKRTPGGATLIKIHYMETGGTEFDLYDLFTADTVNTVRLDIGAGTYDAGTISVYEVLI